MGAAETIAVLGLYNSGSRAVAGVLHRQGSRGMGKKDDFPDELTRAIGAELSPDEVVVWVGQPLPELDKVFGRVVFALGLVWMAAAIIDFCIFAIFSDEINIILILFLFAGIRLLAVPRQLRRLARLTAYVLTNGRALIVNGGDRGDPEITSYSLDRLKDMRCTRNPDGSGSIIFDRIMKGGEPCEVGFLAVPRVDRVERLVRDLTLQRLRPDIPCGPASDDLPQPSEE
jgi:hypothetical protein